jgi:hypothetical protein
VKDGLVGPACTRTIEVASAMAITTTPAATYGRRCWAAKDRSKPRSLNSR